MVSDRDGLRSRQRRAGRRCRSHLSLRGSPTHLADSSGNRVWAALRRGAGPEPPWRMQRRAMALTSWVPDLRHLAGKPRTGLGVVPRLRVIPISTT